MVSTSAMLSNPPPESSGGSRGRDVDFQIEQVAHRAAVLRAVEAMDRRPAGIRIVQRNPIQRRLQPRHDRLGLGVSRPRPAGRRHAAGAELAQHLLPYGRIRRDVADVPSLQAQAGGLEPVVVATQAIAVEHGPVWGSGGLLLRRRDGGPDGRACRQRGCKDYEGDAKSSQLHGHHPRRPPAARPCSPGAARPVTNRRRVAQPPT